MSTDSKPPNPLAQLRAAERSLALAVVESAHTLNIVGTTVMEAVLTRHRMARDAALERIASASEEVQEMAGEVTRAFLQTANSLRGDVAENQEPDLPELMGPPSPQARGDAPALCGPAVVPEGTAQQKALAPRTKRKKDKAVPTQAPALPATEESHVAEDH